MQTIDPGVYDTNVNSFKYLFRYLLKRVCKLNEGGKDILLRTAIIAGTADKYTPFVIEDFCEAKFILREYIRSATGRFPEWCSGLSINVTSTVTKSALEVRPYAETEFWLTADSVVDHSINELILKNTGYVEIDVIKPSPNFTPGYYEDRDLLYEKWSKETSIVSEALKQD